MAGVTSDGLRPGNCCSIRSHMSLILVCIVWIQFITVNSHECVHHLLSQDKNVFARQQYAGTKTASVELRSGPGQNRRRDSETAPIRVTFDISQLKDNIDANRQAYIEKVLAETTSYIEGMVWTLSHL